MNYFFVSQRKTFQAEHSGCYLWAPQDGVWHHELMREIEKGDVIIQYNGSLVGFGFAINNCYSSPKPNSNDFAAWSETKGYRVDVEQYHFITPVNKELISQELIECQPDYHAPLNRNGGVNQCYLFQANQAMVEVILQEAKRIDNSPEQIEIINDIRRQLNIMENPKPTSELVSPSELVNNNGVVFQKNKQSYLSPLILYGPPGTGKTYKMQTEYIDKFAEEDKFITTFHQSFSYEEFVEGLKPVVAEDKPDVVNYKVMPGVFFNACERAAVLAGYESLSDCIKADDRIQKMEEAIKDKKIVLLCIDEINRANVSAVFGDLISLIEPSKRIGAKNEMKVKLPYSKKDFAVPANLLIIGTMNTADRSIQLLDSALRRRFKFEELLPDYTTIGNQTARSILESINARIRSLIDKDHQIGHSYFIDAEDDLDIFNALKDCVIPLLEEYFYNDAQKIRDILNEKDENNHYFYVKDDKAQTALNKMQNEYDSEKEIFMLNPDLAKVKDADKAKEFIAHIV